MPASASAFCWASAPARVIGAIAPASVNGVITTGWLREAISMMPVQHRRVEPQRRVGVDHGEDRRLAIERGVVDAAGDAHHLDAVTVLLAAEAVAVDVLVGERQDVERGVDVAHRCVDVDRLDRVAGDEVDRVEHLGQLEQVVETDLGRRCGARRRGRR